MSSMMKRLNEVSDMGFLDKNKNRRMILTIVFILVVMVLFLTPLTIMFLYVPNDFNEGINEDIRLKISYFDYENYYYKNGETIMPFRLKTPKNIDLNKKYPLAIFLHGGGSHGMDNIKQMCGFYLSNIKKYGEECYVLMPQVPVDTRGWDENMINTIEKCIDNYIIPNYSIDTERVYLSGSSMGGFGTIQALSQNPYRYAAVMFDSGAVPWVSDDNQVDIDIDYNALKLIPMLISHGRNDLSVNIDSIINFTDTLKNLGAKDITLKIYEDRCHETTDLFYYEKSHWEWLFAQRRAKA